MGWVAGPRPLLVIEPTLGTLAGLLADTSRLGEVSAVSILCAARFD
eukprot:COSAG01_NODE_4956_length_4590_cov_7.535070_6_plen_46_part_00